MKLPDSWVLAPIASVCEMNPKLKVEEKPSEDTFVSFVPMSAIDETNATIDQPELKKYFEVSKGYTSFKTNDVLFAKVTPCMENGKAAIVRELENDLGFGSTEFHVLRPSELILPEYILYYVRQSLFREYAKSAFIGTGGLQRVPPGFFERAKIPLPTIPEQKRIVEILHQADTLIQSSKHTNNFGSDLITALFFSMFCNPVLNEKGYPQKFLADLSVCVGGGTPSREKETFWSGDIPWISPKDMKDFFIDSAEEFITSEAVDGSATKVIPQGSVLVVTRSSILKKEFPVCWTTKDAAINQDLKAFIPGKEIGGLFLAVQLKVLEPYFLSQVRQGATVHNIETDRLLKTKIIVPNRTEQSKFERIYLAARKTYEKANARLKIFRELFDHLSLQAFSGELTENWRQNNENAIKEAIKARNAALSTTKQRKFRTTVEIVTETNEAKLLIEEKKIRRSRHTLLKELSNFQKAVRNALQKLNRILIPDDSASLDRFCNELRAENDTNLQDRVLRALDQLTAMGLIAKVSLPNEQGHYLNGFRMLREGESRRVADIQTVNDARERFEEQKAAG